MINLSIDQGISGLVIIALVHLVAGLALGRWFRFGVLLPAFTIVLIESVMVSFRLRIGPWYLLFIGGIIMIQLGYAAAARFRPARSTARRPAPRPSSMRERPGD